jgi:hypothetical protein
VAATIAAVAGTIAAVAGTIAAVAGTIAAVAGTIAPVAATIAAVAGTVAAVAGTVAAVAPKAFPGIPRYGNPGLLRHSVLIPAGLVPGAACFEVLLRALALKTGKRVTSCAKRA